MLILTLRTDKPEAELGFFDNEKKLSYYTWQAHRELSETILIKLNEQLIATKHSLKDIDGIIIYKGPGSFTGLRIGISVANALAYSLDAPIVSQSGGEWIRQGIGRLESDDNEKVALPEYGALPHITQPKK
jgi:tRNA threonylcarbamoyladenosine biosynthesis protein TsaB